MLYKSDSVGASRGTVAHPVLARRSGEPACWGEFDPKTCHAITREQKFPWHRPELAGAHLWLERAALVMEGRGLLQPRRRTASAENARVVVMPGRNKPATDPGVRLRSPWLRDLWPLPGEDRPDVGPWPVRGPIKAGTRLKTLQDARRAARLAARELNPRGRPMTDNERSRWPHRPRRRLRITRSKRPSGSTESTCYTRWSTPSWRTSPGRDEAHLELRCLRGIGDRLLTFLTDGAVANHNKNARKARA